MFINHNDKKLVHALIYFLNNTSWSGKKKLYKLLFVLDFEHYAVTGRSVTGLDYFAWKMGPVPTALHEAIDSEDDLIQNAFRIEIKRSTIWCNAPRASRPTRRISSRAWRITTGASGIRNRPTCFSARKNSASARKSSPVLPGPGVTSSIGSSDTAAVRNGRSSGA